MARMHPMLPRGLPTLEMMLADLGHPSAAEVAKWLGVSERTVYGWKRSTQAPRTALLALFWLTRWGFSALDTHRENQVQVLQSLTVSLNNENAGLRTRIARLEETGDFGTANDPVRNPDGAPFRPATIAQVMADATRRDALPIPAGTRRAA